MAQIEVLDSDTINKISAGEVIERPASALKELLENSADSGADRIEIDFEAGGKKLIQVRDNGDGISSDDMMLALTRHATSKLKTISDLDDISTFGFRGEALASLASVSRMSLRSAQGVSDKGHEILVVGGKVEAQQAAPPLKGTQVRVEDLFFNVPARLKFLKSDAGETSAFKKVIKAFGLIHPHIEIFVKQNQKPLFSWKKSSFLDRCAAVLEVKKNELKELTSDTGSYKFHGACGLPSLSQPTSQNIWIFIQGRFVQDRTVQQALLEGYRGFLMDHQFPMAVIDIRLPGTEVDVNVHPAKAQVKFREAGQIFRWVAQTIASGFKENLTDQIHNVESAHAEKYFTPSFQPDLIRETVVQYNQRLWDVQPMQAQAMRSETLAEKILSEPKNNWGRLHVIGQLAQTYIVAQDEKNLILIDQHASHERVLYETFKEKITVKKEGLEKQISLFEEPFELSTEEAEVLTEGLGLKALSDLGFEIHSRGPEHVSVTARPSLLSEVPLQPLLKRLAEQILDKGQNSALENYVHELLATMACHGAIRAGKTLSQAEMLGLLEQMDPFSGSSFCPHGRPVSVVLSLDAVERLFKRVT